MTDFEMAHAFSNLLKNAEWETVNGCFDKWASYWYAGERLYVTRWREKGFKTQYHFITAKTPMEAIMKIFADDEE